ncbi:MAG TPA: transglutaminase-like domain-containing protein [Syntrophales bacterium]|nr:transglutaminase-like domain-containing protein [Syntrophales bacterium]
MTARVGKGETAVSIGPARRRFFILPAVLLILLSLAACAPFYLQALRAPSGTVKLASPGELSGKELWYGIVFNGEKVGFSRLSVTPLPDGRRFLLRSELQMVIRFLGLQRRVHLRSEETVDRDLNLLSFRYVQTLDDKTLTLEGERSGGNLLVRVQGPGGIQENTLAVAGEVLPASAVNLYPPLRGLAVGARYRYRVFEPQTVQVYDVEQEIVRFERAPALGLRESFRVETRMGGYEATTWIAPEGVTEMEFGLGGVLITHREDEEEAKRYLVASSLAKKDVILDFSLIRTERGVPCPRGAEEMRVILSGLPGDLRPPEGAHQEVAEERQNGERVFSVHTRRRPFPGGGPPTEETLRSCLAPHVQIESRHPEIRRLGAQITSGVTGPREKIERLCAWVAREIKDEAVDAFSALEVLTTRKGECQAHTLLYTALARSVGIPTRLVGGVVYLEGHGFLYHSWAESHAGGWVAVDPTFGQVPADATHIKLVEGPDWSSFLPLGRVVGRLGIRILAVTCAPGHPGSGLEN